MKLTFRRVDYDTEDEQDMTKLQYVLDGIDVKERVKAKTQVAALFASRNANPD